MLTDVVKDASGTPQIAKVDDLTVTVTMKRPWVPFPLYLSGAIGYMASPTWQAAADGDPALESKPVGTGPFVFKDYKPGESFTATKNPNYWNKPYPYLDEVEFRVIPDALTRSSALEAGDVDLIHTTNGDTIKKYRDEPDQFPMTEWTKFGETGYTLLHVTQEGSPLTDSRVRCAMAYATDNQAIIDKINAGISQIANGPFSPGQLGNEAENGFPLKQDMAKAQELVASLQGGPSRPAQHQPVDDPGRDEPDHRPGPAAVLQGGRLRRRADQSDRAGEVHPHGAPRPLPGLPVAQPRRGRPRRPVHLVALRRTRSPSISSR